jgi:hypothetical protein
MITPPFFPLQQVLTDLDFSENPSVGPRGFHYIAESMNNNVGMQTLSLSNCGAGDVGLKDLAVCMENRNRTLISLDVTNNTITEAGVLCMVAAVKINAVLQEVKIDLASPHYSLRDGAESESKNLATIQQVGSQLVNVSLFPLLLTFPAAQQLIAGNAGFRKILEDPTTDFSKINLVDKMNFFSKLKEADAMQPGIFEVCRVAWTLSCQRLSVPAARTCCKTRVSCNKPYSERRPRCKHTEIWAR